jgi:hypothetical protein
MVLSYSRKAYSEAVFRQDTETFLRCLENGLRAFGGVPLLLNLDNLKAAVLKADWFDPEINPKLADFCQAVEMAGFASLLPSGPAVGMAGFDSLSLRSRGSKWLVLPSGLGANTAQRSHG